MKILSLGEDIQNSYWYFVSHLKSFIFPQLDCLQINYIKLIIHSTSLHFSANNTVVSLHILLIFQFFKNFSIQSRGLKNSLLLTFFIVSQGLQNASLTNVYFFQHLSTHPQAFQVPFCAPCSPWKTLLCGSGASRFLRWQGIYLPPLFDHGCLQALFCSMQVTPRVFLCCPGASILFCQTWGTLSAFLYRPGTSDCFSL